MFVSCKLLKTSNTERCGNVRGCRGDHWSEGMCKAGGRGGACGCVMTDVLAHAEIQYFQV